MNRTLIRFVAPLIALGLLVFAVRYGATHGGSSGSGGDGDARADAGPPVPRRFFELFLTAEQPAPGFHELRNGDTVLLVSDEPLISNADVASASAVAGPTGAAMVELVWTAEGRRRFAEATRIHQGRTLVLLIDQHVETMLAFDAVVDQPSVQIGQGESPTMESAAAFAARFNRVPH